MNEEEMVQEVIGSTFLKGRPSYTEVPFGRPTGSNKRIDIVALEEVPGESAPLLIAIEAKLANWKQALQQAFLNLFATDYSYVALPEGRLRSVDRRLFESSGIGLLSVNGSVESMVAPVMSGYTISEKKDFIIAWCRRVEGERNAAS